MQVIKRDGHKEAVSFDKVLSRVRKAARGLSVNPDALAQQVLSQIYDGVKTSELDELTGQLAASLSTAHPDYGTLAARISVSNHHKNTSASFSETIQRLANQVHPKTGEPLSSVSKDLVWVVEKHGARIDAYIQYDRDYLFDYFGFKTLEKSYLLRDSNHNVVERPQHMWMRVALGLWWTFTEEERHMGSLTVKERGLDTDTRLTRAFETYDLMSQKFLTHATPTLFNAGTPRPQLSSCFLLSMSDDSIAGIYKTLGDCASISKYAGGIGLHVHNIRARGSLIRGTNGTSNGLTPMLRVFNNTARYVDQGGGRRNGSFAIYLEPWHADVEDFLKMKLPTGAEEERARDLFYALWIPDLFMERVEADGDWSLFCPNEAPGLADVVGDEFKTLYESYEAKGRARKTVKAQKLWFQILDTQMETGTPYLLYKDAANKKSNQQNLGVIKSSNLCVAPETLILTDKGQFPIKELSGQKARVWNGESFSETTVLQTGTNQELVDVVLSNGVTITTTLYHKFLVSENYNDKKTIASATRIGAQDLKPGMKLKKYELPTLPGDSSQDMKYSYTHGFFCGDGTYSNGKPMLRLYGEKQKLLEKLEIRTTTGITDAQGALNTQLPLDLSKKFQVPINASLLCRLGWLAGLCDADGSVAKNGDNESIQIGSIEYGFLRDVQTMLAGMGIHSKVTKMRDATKHLLPDGKGGYKEFDCQPLYRLLISSNGLYKLTTLGFQTHRLKFVSRKPQRDALQFIKVVEVVRTGRRDDTYCFNEPENHAGVFNGVLTGNCTEIMEYSSPDETAVCNLASIALPSFVSSHHLGGFDFEALRKVVAVAVRNLNRVIDINYYPTPETRLSNMRHRPIGLGVQGLADVFALLGLSWESEEAARLNRLIFEHMYYAAVAESTKIAESEGAYQTFEGSPASQGRLQPDLWGQTPMTETDGTLNWSSLREAAKKGMRNSLLVAPMPTASTSQILGYTECFEPFTSNIYTRRTLAGEFIVINKYLLKDLMTAGIWSDHLKQKIVAQNGSVQGIAEIPESIQARYKTSWELKQRVLIDMAADRGAFICQSQSLNLFVADATYSKLTSMHFYAWKKGLKTGCYYLRTKAPVTAQKFTVDPRMLGGVNVASAPIHDQEEAYRSDSDSDDEEAEKKPAASAAPKTREQERRELMDRLAREYEEELAKGCTSCSS